MPSGTACPACWMAVKKGEALTAPALSEDAVAAGLASSDIAYSKPQPENSGLESTGTPARQTRRPGCVALSASGVEAGYGASPTMTSMDRFPVASMRLLLLVVAFLRRPVWPASRTRAKSGHLGLSKSVWAARHADTSCFAQNVPSWSNAQLLQARRPRLHHYHHSGS
jgi:hypothetical protein